MKPKHVLQIGSWVISSVIGGALVSACASSGTEPHAMTAGQHQAAAASEEQTAAAHQAQYNPSTTEAPRKGPGPGAYSACISYERSNCYVRWRSEENPTDKHRKEAEEHKKLAEKHRAASQALREAEQRFCGGIPAADRDLSPFYHREDITRIEAVKMGAASDVYGGDAPTLVQVQPIEKEVLGPGGLLGARITFRAVPGMTPEWLQRVVDCHLARNAVVGQTADMTFCPLAVPHATANVSSTGTGFAVDVTTDQEERALEIVHRAQRLAPTGPSVEK